MEAKEELAMTFVRSAKNAYLNVEQVTLVIENPDNTLTILLNGMSEPVTVDAEFAGDVLHALRGL